MSYICINLISICINCPSFLFVQNDFVFNSNEVFLIPAFENSHFFSLWNLKNVS